MIDLSPLAKLAPVQDAVEALSFAESALRDDPSLAQGDPTAFKAIFALYSFAMAGGRVEDLLAAIARAGSAPQVGRA
ncbi:hypothetical protein [Methylobacterium sp. JK268]